MSDRVHPTNTQGMPRFLNAERLTPPPPPSPDAPASISKRFGCASCRTRGREVPWRRRPKARASRAAFCLGRRFPVSGDCNVGEAVATKNMAAARSGLAAGQGACRGPRTKSRRASGCRTTLGPRQASKIAMPARPTASPRLANPGLAYTPRRLYLVVAAGAANYEHVASLSTAARSCEPIPITSIQSQARLDDPAR